MSDLGTLFGAMASVLTVARFVQSPSAPAVVESALKLLEPRNHQALDYLQAWHNRL